MSRCIIPNTLMHITQTRLVTTHFVVKLAKNLEKATEAQKLNIKLTGSITIKKSTVRIN